MNSTHSNQKWYDKKWQVFALLILFFPIGLFGLWKNQDFSKLTKILLTVLVSIFVLAFIAGDDKNKSSISNKNEQNSPTGADEIDKNAQVNIGEILHTEYFDIIVNKVNISDRVSTGNEFADLKPEQGNLYLILNVSFKNIDNESRYISEGSVLINYNGKDYEFDKSETILFDGWGLFLDQINPLTSKTTNLVYKIPTEIQGDAYWRPGRASNDEKIFIGKLK